jgi:hypothetical protein
VSCANGPDYVETSAYATRGEERAGRLKFSTVEMTTNHETFKVGSLALYVLYSIHTRDKVPEELSYSRLKIVA